MVLVELLVPVPLSALVLRLADVDAAICKTENNTTQFKERLMSTEVTREEHIFFHYVRNGMNVFWKLLGSLL